MNTFLQKGQVAILRTDTLYGLVASMSDEEAVEKVYQLKGRDFTKPCIVLVSDEASIGEYGDLVAGVSSQYTEPTTVVVPSTTEPSWITRGGDTVAYRIPHDEALRALLKETGPLIAPSANPQGLPPAKNIEEAREYFGQQVDHYLDGGEVSSQMVASQLIQVNTDGSQIKLR